MAKTKGAVDKRPRKPRVSVPADEVIMRYRNGESCESISRSFNCSAMSIVKKLKKWGVYISNRKNNKNTY